MKEEDAIKEKFEKLLEMPSEEKLAALIRVLKGYVGHIPSCPRCLSDNVRRNGSVLRKTGRERQFQCKDCGHAYTHSSIKGKEARESYPRCPDCGSRSCKRGFWRWELKDGTQKMEQRYQCKSLECGRFFPRGGKKRAMAST